MIKRRHVAAGWSMAALILGGLVTLGCQSAARGGTEITVNAGRASEAVFPGDVGRVHHLAVGVVEDLGFRLGMSPVDQTEGVVRATTAGGSDVSILVEAGEPGYAKVIVLIGLPGVGDVDRQRVVLERIESRARAVGGVGAPIGR